MRRDLNARQEEKNARERERTARAGAATDAIKGHFAMQEATVPQTLARLVEEGGLPLSFESARGSR